jgi:hypothetical protein
LEALNSWNLIKSIEPMAAVLAKLHLLSLFAKAAAKIDRIFNGQRTLDVVSFGYGGVMG